LRNGCSSVRQQWPGTWPISTRNWGSTPETRSLRGSTVDVRFVKSGLRRECVLLRHGCSGYAMPSPVAPSLNCGKAVYIPPNPESTYAYARENACADDFCGGSLSSVRL